MAADERAAANDVILQRITLTRRLRGDTGEETVSFEYDADIAWVNDLGLLEAAKIDLHERCRADWHGPGANDRDDSE